MNDTIYCYPLFIIAFNVRVLRVDIMTHSPFVSTEMFIFVTRTIGLPILEISA